MIVCISGPSSTGKTTLFSRLKDNKNLIESIWNERVEFSEELVRSTIDRWFPGKTFDQIIDTTYGAVQLQLKIAESVSSSYVEMIKDSNTLYICDRSPLDNVAYTLLNYQSSDPEAMMKYAEDLSNSCSKMRYLTSYVDRIYLTSVDRENQSYVERDGLRPISYEYRRQLEIELFNTLFDFHPKVIKLPSISNDRINTIFTDFSTLLRK